MTPEISFKLGAALVLRARKQGRTRPVVLVGKDTRLSGYLFETSVAAGVCAYGGDVLLTGPIPTPAVARLTTTLKADAGVMISASHNAFQDNGIKVFGADGYKLDDAEETALEARIHQVSAMDDARPQGAGVGAARRVERARDIYETCLKTSVPATLSFRGVRIVFDGAHGAAYATGPEVLTALGAEVDAIGVSPNGSNINAEVGATAPQRCAEEVVRRRADLGIALDGDADRAIFVDHEGHIIDGDAVIALCAKHLKERGRLPGDTVVATVMSNLGLEKSMARQGIQVVRCAVGDRYVVERMRQEGYAFGGEQSGHLIFSEHATTGDGMMSALQVLALLQSEGRNLRDLADEVLMRYPQALESVALPQRMPLEEMPSLMQASARISDKLGDEGRVLVRWSGTEPKLRVLVEGHDAAEVAALAQELVACAQADAKA